MSRIRWAAIASISGFLAAAPALADVQPSSSAINQCYGAGRVESIEQCPSGGMQAGKLGTREAPRSRLRAAERKKEEAKEQKRGPSIDIDLATRMNREKTQQRAWDLLQKEVQVLKRLVSNTRTDDARRPEILLRLAETYFEMQTTLTARVRSFDDPIHQACKKQKNAQKCKQVRDQQKQANDQLNETRQESLRTYATLVQDHPNFTRMDEVLFALAFGLEQVRQFERARQVYHRLIKGFPQSKFIPNAYLSFAEFYFNQGDMRPAIQFYDKVLEFPPERNPVYGYAMYKSAWAHYNLEDYRKSLQKFVETIEFADKNPSAADAANLARQSRRELVLPYAMVGTPRAALQFFQRYAKDRDQAFDMLEKLAELYFDTGQWENTIAVYHELMAQLSTSDKLCYWQSKVTNAIVSSKPKADQVRETQRLVDIWEAFNSQNHAEKAKMQCKQETATVLVSLATAWHREAVGTDTQPGTNDRKTMDLASKLYRNLVEKFPDMESLEYPDIDKRDWPTHYRVAYFHAELLWKMEEWAQCGPAFDKVVELNPKGEFVQDAAYAAVLCYNNLYQQQYQSRERESRAEAGRGKGKKGAKPAPEESDAEKFAQRDFTQLEKGMLDAFQRYVCFIKDGEDLPTIKYRRARIYYEANHFEEAAFLFKDIALNHKDTELAEYAANLYLDSLNILGTKGDQPRTACITEMRTSIEPLANSFCSTPQAKETHADLCGVLGQLRCDVLRKEAESFEKNKEFKKAAATYVSVFRRYQECGRLDEVLFNAAINFEAARLLGNAITVRNVLRERFPDSPLAKKAIYLLGANWHAIAMYDRAAQYYEEFARKFPGEKGDTCTEEEKKAGTCAIAHDALMNAVFFRLGLGQESEAIEDAKLFEKNYRQRLPRQTAQVQFAVGSIYERNSNWNGLVDHYQKFLRSYGKSALPHQTIMANVLIARAHWARDDKAKARPFFDAAVKEWGRGAAERINKETDVAEAERIGWMREALDGTAEALFHLSEYRYDDFRKIKFPEYKAGKSLEKVNKWSEKEFRPWVDQKRKALVAAEGDYNKVAALKLPITGNVTLESPPWQIAAAARIGEMYRSFVNEFRDAPIPSEIEKDPELFDIYVGALDEQSEPLVKQAVDKFEFCLTTATNVRWFNDWSRKCEQELNGLDPRRYPMAAELTGRGEYVYQTVAKPGAAELGSSDDDANLGDATAAGGDS